MVFKVKEKLTYDAGYTEYQFNVLSEADGLRIVLTEWRHQIEGMKLKRWSFIGDDGTFAKRSSITIPPEVIESVKQKVSSSIYLDSQ